MQPAKKLLINLYKLINMSKLYIKSRKLRGGLILSFVLSLLSFTSFGQTTFTVTNINDSGEGSLRQAIINANSTVAKDNILFNIPGNGPHVLQPTQRYPYITNPVNIDAESQPGWAVGSLKIVIDGSTVPIRQEGLY